jgi:POT family proton-dependent oligopeptide transporter
MSSGFIVMFFASQAAASGFSVAPYWLITTYFLHTVGELCLSPVALSAVSRLSPKRLAGQMMGVFTLTYSIGSLVAGLIAGKFDPGSIYQMPNLYLQITFFLICSGIVIAIFATRTRNWESLLEEPAASLETKS